MKAVILVVFVLTVAAVLCLLEAYREQQYFKVTEDGVVSRRLNGLKKEKKIVFLSDLHNKEYGVGNERLLDAICKARPDLILIGGDMLVGKKGCSVAPALKFVSKLPAIAPVYYACGNHEQRMKRKPEVYGEVYQAYQKQLEECGVHFLENSSVLLKEDDCRIRISALELPLATYTKFKKYRVTEQDVTACIEKEAADYEILLAHNPVYFDAYKKWGADLVLSGHTHGGQLFPLMTIENHTDLAPDDRVYGYEKRGSTNFIVTSGISDWAIKFKTGCRSEYLMLEIDGK